MRRFIPLVLLAACSSKSPPGPAPSPALVKIASLVPASVTSVGRFGQDSPMITMFGTLGADKVVCWGGLVKKVTASYSFSNAKRDMSIVILEGDLPRRDVEACVVQAMADTVMPVTLESDGELAVFATKDAGKAYVAWKDGLVIVGGKVAVNDVLTGPRSKDPWAARLAQLPAAAVAAANVDPLTTTLFGIPTHGYDIVVESPKPPIRGRIIIRAKSGSEASAIAKKIAAGEIQWPGKVSPKVAEAIKKLPIKVSGNDVEIGFDDVTLGGLDKQDLEKLGEILLGGDSKHDGDRGAGGAASDLKIELDHTADFAPKVTKIDPERGDIEGGTYVRIVGNGFLTDGQGNPAPTHVKVYFGSRQGEVIRVASDTELIVQAPGGKPNEVVDVLVMFDGRGDKKLEKAFTFVDKSAGAPTVDDLNTKP